MAIKTRVWGIGRFLVLMCALAATFTLFAMASMRVALRAREVTVPTLVGMEPTEATGAADAVGLTLKADDNRPFDPKIQAGRIAIQEPAAGAVARRGRSVRVWISAGSRQSLVPRVSGETERTAQARIQQDGLQVTGVADIRSSDYPADAVVAQDPAPGARATALGLLVNRGERLAGFVMPDLIGVPGDEAMELLRSKGLRVTVVAQQPYPGVPAGVILRQNPTAGFQITPDQPISLEVSR
ncbi:MAG: PASTA domain-containing protein [Acidobacteriota bacterium]